MAPCLDVKGGRQASRGASKRANAEERAPNAGYAWPEAFGAVCGSMRIGGIEVEEEGSRRGPLQITSITSQRLTATWVMTSVMHDLLLSASATDKESCKSSRRSGSRTWPTADLSQARPAGPRGAESTNARGLWGCRWPG